MEIPPTHYPASRAASVVENCINYQQGTPHKVFLVQTVHQASMEDIPGRGHKYRLKFSVEEIIQKQVTVNCTAEVLYPPVGQDTAPEVNFTFEGEIGKNPDEEDNTFYQKLKSMKEPLEAQNIPDSFGNISPEMKPVRHLAWVACGYIVWQNSTENTWYKMVKIQTVKQVTLKKLCPLVVSNEKEGRQCKEATTVLVSSIKDRLSGDLLQLVGDCKAMPGTPLLQRLLQQVTRYLRALESRAPRTFFIDTVKERITSRYHKERLVYFYLTLGHTYNHYQPQEPQEPVLPHEAQGLFQYIDYKPGRALCMQRNDDFIELDYTILLHDIPSQEIIPWQMQVLWHPQYGTKVKHNSRLPKEAPVE